MIRTPTQTRSQTHSKSRLLLATLLGASLAASAWAQVRDDTGPLTGTRDNDFPLETRADWKRDDGTAQKDHLNKDKDYAGKAAYKGILRDNFGASVRPLQREQAVSQELKPGVGLVVEEVNASSVAANGGLQKGDVIFKVGDQWVINAEQFATLLSIQEADNGFEIKVHRGTERVDLDYKFDQTALDTMNRGFQPVLGAPDQSFDRDIDRLGDRSDLDRNIHSGNNPMIIPEKFDFKDDQHVISIRTDDGVKKLTVKDKDDNVLFDGPYNTLQDRQAVPDDIRAKVESVLREKVK